MNNQASDHIEDQNFNIWSYCSLHSSLFYRLHSEEMGKVLFSQVSVCQQPGGTTSPSHNIFIHWSHVFLRISQCMVPYSLHRVIPHPVSMWGTSSSPDGGTPSSPDRVLMWEIPWPSQDGVLSIR